MKRWMIGIAGVLTLTIISMVAWLFHLDDTIVKRLKERRFALPLEIYSAPELLRNHQPFSREIFESDLIARRFRKRTEGEPIHAGDYGVWDSHFCMKRLEEAWSGDGTPPNSFNCFEFSPHGSQGSSIIVFDQKNEILALYERRNDEIRTVEVVERYPELFGQFYSGEPILRRVVSLGKVPVKCLEAVIAIEDGDFMEHHGVSLKGISRAFYRNFSSGRLVQGGSTITQQLIKNYFLTGERSLKRKVTEALMALLIEARVSKDEILETYLNLIYMGQNGSYQVRGFGAASKHYFNKELEDLNLADCALLAAIVNSPGLYNPFKSPDRSVKRRQLVLERMVQEKFIDQNQFEEATKQSLPQWKTKGNLQTAPYFVDVVKDQLQKLGFSDFEGLKVYTTLRPRYQLAAQNAVQKGLEALEKRLKERRGDKAEKESADLLEGMLIGVDVDTGFVRSVVGGRDFGRSQFNRVLNGHRQVGSIMKPFVYLAALESFDDSGKSYQALSPILDESFEIRYEGQKWKPQNYEKKYYGTVPLFFALKSSLNAATARLGQKVGFEGIIDVVRRLGIVSELAPLPSLTLGAFELFSWEVALSYATIARMGEQKPLTYILAIENQEGEVVYRPQDREGEQVVAKDVSAILIGMMKETIRTGTARSIPLNGFDLPAAGKTGTTSDLRDAWFAGFTPDHVAVSWVGYDDNRSHGLTGASGAIPIWTRYMNEIKPFLASRDFNWPHGVEIHRVEEPPVGSEFSLPSDGTNIFPVELVFRLGEHPQ